MTQFRAKLYAFKASRTNDTEQDPQLTFERLKTNQDPRIETTFMMDNNLMIHIDDACNSGLPATDPS